MSENQMIEKVARGICPNGGNCERCNAAVAFECLPKQTAKKVYEAGYCFANTITVAEAAQKMQDRLKKELREYIPFGLERIFYNIIDRVAREVAESK